MFVALLGAAAPGPPREGARVEALRKAVLGDDAEAARSALTELRSMGEPGAAALLGVTRQVLTRTKGAIDRDAALLKDGDKLKAVQDQLDALRKSAGENLEKLDKGPTL